MRGGLLRIVIVVGAIGIGVLLLANGFGDARPGIVAESPSGGKTNGTGDGNGGSPTPKATNTPTSTPTPEATCHRKGVTVAVFNATQTDGLAGLAQQRLERKGYVFPNDPGNSPQVSPITLVYFSDRSSRLDGECLAQALIAGAKVQKLPSGADFIPRDVDLAALLGTDYAAENPPT